MSNKGKLITLKVGTLNCRGLRKTGKRRAIYRQLKEYCDLIHLQDTHLDNDLSKQVEKEFSGSWSFNHRSNNSGGVAIHIKSNAGRVVEDEAYQDDDGRIIGRLINIEDYKIYCISAYAPCLDSSCQKRAKNMKFLTQLEKLIMAKKARGLEVLVTGDLNFIRDEWLDAEGGKPTVYQEQKNWMTHLEENCGMHDAMRFLRPEERMFTWSRTNCHRRLDYILCSKKLLERAKETIITPIPSSDHRFIGIEFELGKDPIAGPGIWRHNDKLLNDDEYTKMMIDCSNMSITTYMKGIL